MISASAARKRSKLNLPRRQSCHKSSARPVSYTHLAAVWASFATGVGITVANMFIGFIDSAINAGAITMLVGLVIVPVVSLLTKPLPKEQIEQSFACYEEQVTVARKYQLRHDDK